MLEPQHCKDGQNIVIPFAGKIRQKIYKLKILKYRDSKDCNFLNPHKTV